MSSDWTKRGWRRRSDLERGQTLTRVEVEIERLEAKAAAADKTCDELYYTLRMADGVAIDEGFFDDEERCTGPDGSYPELEQRWQKQNPAEFADETKEGAG